MVLGTLLYWCFAHFGSTLAKLEVRGSIGWHSRRLLLGQPVILLRVLGSLTVTIAALIAVAESPALPPGIPSHINPVICIGVAKDVVGHRLSLLRDSLCGAASSLAECSPAERAALRRRGERRADARDGDATIDER